MAIVLPWIQEIQLGYGKFNLGYVKFSLGYGKFKGKERRKHPKSGRARSKKGHMATPINGQNSKRFESIPNQDHTVFGWEIKIIDLRVYLKSC